MHFQRDTKFQKTKKPACRFSRKSASQESDSIFRKADSQKCESAFLFVVQGRREMRPGPVNQTMSMQSP
jgi:hypothetical protein